jgi:ABC-type phosphate transport system auxiliary subunit
MGFAEKLKIIKNNAKELAKNLLADELTKKDQQIQQLQTKTEELQKAQVQISSK